MPRRTIHQAGAQASKSRESRWRYVLRHPEFQKDIRAIRSAGYTHEVYSQIFHDLKLKWGVNCLSLVSHHSPPLPELNPETVQFFESFFEKEGDLLIYEPVSSYDEYNGWDDQCVPPPGTRPGQRLHITAHLNYPYDVLMALIGLELKKALQTRQEREHQESEHQGLAPPRPQRQRLDKVDHHLAAYDLAEKGETFAAIARTTHRRVSTVKSAFLAARRNIFSTKFSAPTENAPSKQELPLIDFDPHTHTSQCATCRRAERSEDMCARARKYALLDYVSQRELPGADTTRSMENPDEEETDE